MLAAILLRDVNQKKGPRVWYRDDKSCFRSLTFHMETSGVAYYRCRLKKGAGPGECGLKGRVYGHAEEVGL
jgi:hypothetical protein